MFASIKKIKFSDFEIILIWVKNCCVDLISPSIASRYFIIRLDWVPGHSGVPGNCKADELARDCTFVQILSAYHRVGLTVSLSTLALVLCISRELSSRWSSTSSYATARSFYGTQRNHWTTRFQQGSSAVVEFLLGVHAVKLTILSNANCRSPGTFFSIVQLLKHHSSHKYLRRTWRITGTHFNRLNNFVAGSKRFRFFSVFLFNILVA